MKNYTLGSLLGTLLLTACVNDVFEDPTDEPPVLEESTISGQAYYAYEVFREDRDGWKWRVDTIWVEDATVRIANAETSTNEDGAFSLDVATTYPVDVLVEHQDYEPWTGRLDSAGQALFVGITPKTTPWIDFTVGNQFEYTYSYSYRSQDGTSSTRDNRLYTFTVESVDEMGSETHVRLSEIAEGERRTEYFVVPSVSIEEIDYTGSATVVLDSLSRIVGVVNISLDEPGTSSGTALVFRPRPNRNLIAVNMPVFADEIQEYRSPDGNWTSYTKEFGILRHYDRFGPTVTKVTDL